MAGENGEPETAAEIAAARADFLSNPPEVLATDEPVVDTAAEEAALEAAALAELTTPPAGSEAAAATAAAAAPAPAPAGTIDPFAAFGGEESVRTAHAVQEALRTEQGLRALVANGLTALGYNPQQIADALEAGAAPIEAEVDDPFEGLEDDDTIDVKTMRQLLADVAANAAQQALAASAPQLATVEEQVLAQQQLNLRNTVDANIIATLGAPPVEPAERATYASRVDAIVQRASTMFDPAQSANPQHVQQVIATAHAQIEAENDARFQAYLATKRTARDAAPPNINGGAGTEGALPEPKNLKEAREQARATGFFG